MSADNLIIFIPNREDPDLWDGFHLFFSTMDDYDWWDDNPQWKKVTTEEAIRIGNKERTEYGYSFEPEFFINYLNNRMSDDEAIKYLVAIKEDLLDEFYVPFSLYGYEMNDSENFIEALDIIIKKLEIFRYYFGAD